METTVITTEPGLAPVVSHGAGVLDAVTEHAIIATNALGDSAPSGPSAPVHADRLPTPVSPYGLSLLGTEGAGEVLTSVDVVFPVLHGPWGEDGTIQGLLELAGVADCADRRPAEMSGGQQQRVAIVRAVMTDPELLLLDEPTASLDLGAREELLALLGGYAQAPTTPAMIMVTHHVEEIPVGFTHVLLLREGAVVAAGPIAQTLTAENLSATFGMPIALTAEDGRFAARATG